MVKQKSRGRHVELVFDEYESSKKDYDHGKRLKNYLGCTDIEILQDKPCPVPKANF